MSILKNNNTNSAIKEEYINYDNTNINIDDNLNKEEYIDINIKPPNSISLENNINLIDTDENINIDDANFNIVSENIIRKISHYIYKKFNLQNIVHSSYYIIVHWLFLFFVSFIILFNNNVCDLIIVFIILSLDAFAVVVLHGCPYTKLEEKYLNITTDQIKQKIFKNLGIVYNCSHIYESQIEILSNTIMLVIIKCLSIIILNTFNFKLINYNNLYV